jgi:hypothetical protein
LTFCTERLKPVETLRPPESVAVTVSASMPTSAFPGVPLNVRVLGSKVNQVGKLPPPASRAW